VLLRLANGDPLLLEKPLGRGRVLLWTTTASLEWTNLPSAGLALFVPLLERASLAGTAVQADAAYAPGQRVTVLLAPGQGRAGDTLDVVLPDGQIRSAPLRVAGNALAADCADTRQLGLYRWKARGDGAAAPAEGAFAVNADGAESDMATVVPADLAAALGPNRCVVAPTVDQAERLAAASAAGVNLSEWFLAAVLLLLVVLELFSRLRLRVDAGGLGIRYGHLGWLRQRIALERIQAARGVRLEPMEHGGFGYRGSLRFSGRAALVVRAGWGLELVLDGGKRLAISVDDAERGAELNNRFLARRTPPGGPEAFARG
jgi:hypothetical protein